MGFLAGFIGGSLGATSLAASASAAVAAGATFAATAAGQLLFSVSVTALSRALGPKSSNPGIPEAALGAGEATPQAFIDGRYGVRGSVSYPVLSHAFSGKPQAMQTWRIDLSDAPITGLVRMAVDGKWVTIDLEATEHPDYGHPVTGDFENVMWIRFRDGTETTADAMLLAKYGSRTDFPYAADMICGGVAQAIVTAKFRPDLMPQRPVFLFEADGTRKYDVRLDITAGGSGAHRADDPSTWAWSRNPMVLAYNLLLGVPIQGETYGLGADPADLALDDFADAINACDDLVNIGGGTGPRYRAGFRVGVDQPPIEPLQEYLKACSGQLADIGGRWVARAGSPLLPIVSLTDDDVIESVEIEDNPHEPWEQRVNAIIGGFPDPASVYEARESALQTSSTWEAEDGGQRRTAQVDYPAVPFAGRVFLLNKEAMSDARRQRRHVLTVAPWAAHALPLSTVEWDSEHFGHQAKDFEVGAVVINLTHLTAAYALREVDPADWTAPDLDEDPTASTGRVQIAAVTVEGFDARALSIPGRGGNPAIPGIEATWTAAPEGATTIHLEVTEVVSGEIVTTIGVGNIDGGRAVIDTGLVAGAAYTIRARPVVPGAPSTWTGAVAVTAPDLRITSADLADPVQADIATGVAGAADATQAQAAAAAAFDRAILSDKQGWAVDGGFDRWAAGALDPANWDVISGLSGVATQVSDTFGTGIEVNVTNPAAASVWVVPKLTGADPDLEWVVVCLDIDYLAGDPAGAGFNAQWSSDGGATFPANGVMLGSSSNDRFSQLGITVSPGVKQQSVFLVQRPAGTYNAMRLRLVFKWDAVSAAQHMIVYRADIRPATEAEIEAGPGGTARAWIDSTGVTHTTPAGAVAAVEDVVAAAGGTSLSNVTTRAVASVDAAGAVGALNTEVSAGTGGLLTSVSSLALVASDLDGNAGAAVVLRANGASLTLTDFDGTPTTLRIAADQLVVTDGSGNLWVNGNFQFGDARGWGTPPAGASVVQRDSGSGFGAIVGAPLQYFAKYDPDTGGGDARWFMIDNVGLDGGGRYSIAVKAAVGGVGTNPTFQVLLSTDDGEGNGTGTFAGTFTPTSTSWADFLASIKLPSNAVQASLSVRRNAGAGKTGFIGDVRLIRQATGATILTPTSVTSREADFVSLAAEEAWIKTLTVENQAINAAQAFDSTSTFTINAANPTHDFFVVVDTTGTPVGDDIFVALLGSYPVGGWVSSHTATMSVVLDGTTTFLSQNVGSAIGARPIVALVPLTVTGTSSRSIRLRFAHVSGAGSTTINGFRAMAWLAKR